MSTVTFKSEVYIATSGFHSDIPQIELAKLSALEFQSQESNGPTIFVIRHGESVLNIPYIVDGQEVIFTSGTSKDISLTSRGFEQAQTLGKELVLKLPKNSKIAVCSSTATRAKQTADTIFNELQTISGCSRDNTEYPGLLEANQGKWEGKIRGPEYNAQLVNWNERSARDKFELPYVEDGESYREVSERALTDLTKVFENHADKDIVFVVAHYRTIWAIFVALNANLESLSTKPKTKLSQLGMENCDMTQLKRIEGCFRFTQHIKTNLGQKH